ncbi:hypothetical protein FFI89_031795 [Bradyrhizobium sp. KBS0727]|jgi:hypothetical protein|uniref:hypothetical protein n=1 Tax=unclassified Bradyrhizobium TaxID=2631580 RepID=UPI00110E90EE|nr:MULTISPECIES: hypothetical protein [unclassified Bradyrhizobium]QDW41304.1 hypothetical protein FFI71_031800 [Bradyrhizobium sp. KBS0725]QDW47910.1 hypothetical protein FFI89_031795 [Bradyrhizobium sp. KBS0727]
MSTLSEQDHLNPRDPRYYAPRWLRERSGSRSLQEAGADTPFSPASFDSELESAVSDALRHPLDPEVMHEPGYSNELEPRTALRTITVRFAAAVGVSALVALFFVVIVPASRQADGETSGASGIVQSIKTALFQPGATDNAPPAATDEFQALLASAQASKPAPQGQSGQLLKQFMQWRQKPNSAAP